VLTASAICWRRANQRARQLLFPFLIISAFYDHSANKELKSGSLARRCRRAQRGGNAADQPPGFLGRLN
jgi:hypothetical protein